MLGCIQTNQFFLRIYTKRCKDPHEPDTDQRSHNSNRNGDHNTQYLCQEQTVISKHKAIPFCNRVNGSFSEETCCDSSPDTTDTMAAKSIQGIIDLQLLFQKEHSKVTDRAYQDPNDKGCPYRYETSSRCNGYQSDNKTCGCTIAVAIVGTPRSKNVIL